jgi:hypothetical protein
LGQPPSEGAGPIGVRKRAIVKQFQTLCWRGSSEVQPEAMRSIEITVRKEPFDERHLPSIVLRAL